MLNISESIATIYINIYIHIYIYIYIYIYLNTYFAETLLRLVTFMKHNRNV